MDSGNILGALFLQESFGRNIQFSTTSLVKALPSLIFIIFPHIFIEKKVVITAQFISRHLIYGKKC